MINSVQFTLDSTRLAVGSYLGCIIIDYNSGQELQTFKNPKKKDNTTFSIKFSHDSELMAIGCNTGCEIYNVKNGVQLKIIKVGELMYTIHFSPDSSMIAIGGEAIGCTLYDLKKGEEIYTLYESYNVLAIHFSPDSSMIAIGAYRNGCIIFNLAGIEIRSLKKGKSIHTLHFSPDSTKLAIGGEGTGCIIYDAKSGYEIMNLRPDDQSFTSVQFSPDQKYLITGSLKSKLYDLQNRNTFINLSNNNKKYLVDISNNSEFIAIAEETGCYIYNTKLGGNNISLSIDQTNINIIKFNQNSTILAYGSNNGCYLFNIVSGEEICCLSGNDNINSVNFSPDSSMIAIGLPKGCRIYNATNYEEMHNLFQDKNVKSVKFSPNSNILAIGGYAIGCILYDLQTKSEIKTYFNKSFVNYFDFSPDSNYLAISLSGCRILDIKTGSVIRVFKEGLRTNCNKFCPESKNIAIAFEGGCTIYNAIKGDLILNIEDNKSYSNIGFSMDNKLLYTNYFVLNMKKAEIFGFEISEIQECVITDSIFTSTYSKISYSAKYGKYMTAISYFVLENRINEIESALNHCPATFFIEYNSYSAIDAIIQTKNNPLLKSILQFIQNHSPDSGNPNQDLYYHNMISSKLHSLLEVTVFNNTILRYLATSNLYSYQQQIPIVSKDFYENNYMKIVKFKSIESEYNSINKKSIWNDYINNEEGVIAHAKLIKSYGLLDCLLIESILSSYNIDLFYNLSIQAFIDTVWKKHFYTQFLKEAIIKIIYCIISVLLLYFVTEGNNLNSLYSLICTVFLVCASVYMLYYEIYQIIYSRLNYIYDFWNIIDIFSVLCTIWYIITLSMDAEEYYKATAAVCTMAFNFTGVLKILRGYKNTGIVIRVLEANTVDMGPFLGVMSLIILSFSFVFYALMQKPEIQKCWNIDLGDSRLDQTCNYASISMSLWSTIKMGLLGDFDVGTFQFAHNMQLGFIMFLMAVTVITIIMLNGLIALLGDSYSRETEHLKANLYRDRLSIIYDILKMYNKEQQISLKERFKYIHVLIPEFYPEEDYSDSNNNFDQWEGIAKNIKKFMHEENKYFKNDNIKLRKENNELNIKVTDLSSKVNELKSDISEMKQDLRSITDILSKIYKE